MSVDPQSRHPTPLPCVRCGYLADTSAGPLNFCPKCGLDLRAPVPSGPEPTTSMYLGQVVADRYRVTELLGEGGMGAVFKAEHVRMGKALALKLLRGNFARDAAAVERFKTEARIVSRLSHPHTIAVFDFGELRTSQGFYLAMEYVPGRDLAAVLREGRLDEGRAVLIAEQLLGSLSEAHESGIVHRDIKPANVMLSATESGDFVKVLDFGIAKLRDSGTGETTQGVIIGTPNYLSPEQARGEDIDARADLYSVGALLYELVAGRPPFVNKNPVAVMQAHLNQLPPPLKVLAPWVSEELAVAIHKALQKRPEDRFQTASDMRRALLGTQGRPSGRFEPPRTTDAHLASRADFEELDRRLRRLRVSRVATPLLALLLAGLVAAGAWRWPEVHDLLRRRLPAVAALVPAPLRPPERFDGREAEPNDTPAQATRVPLPPAPDGPALGEALVRGHVGARLDANTGDVDVFRIEVADLGRPVQLRADWSGPAAGEGIRGLDVVLSLNRERGADGPRRQAPLVAQVDRGGPGRPERLTALVEPGVYYLSVRERHEESTGPVEKPTDEYQLRLTLSEPRSGEEVEPNDDPESVEHREHRYPEWRGLGERNPLSEGGRVEGETSPEDPDTFAVAPRRAAELPELLVVLPAADLAITTQLWIPDAGDLSPSPGVDRERFEEAAEGRAGELLALPLSPPPREGAPTLLRLRGAATSGRYEILALGPGSGSGQLVLSRLEALVREGRGAQALELAAAYARLVPSAAARTEVLVRAGRAAEELAGATTPLEVRDFDRAARRLGLAVFEVVDWKVRYGAAFEALARGTTRLDEEALGRAAERVLPCTPEEVARRAQLFLTRFPSSPRAQAVRLRLARALEESHWQGGRGALRKAQEQYAVLARGAGPEAREAAERGRELSQRRPVRPAVSRLRCE